MNEFFEDVRKRLGLKDIAEAKANFKKQQSGYEGDFAITLALRESRKTGVKLETVANEIGVKMEKSPFVKRVKVSNGYVNCWYDYGYLFKELFALVDTEYGKSSAGKKEKIMIEHTSVNPNKALHIGHVRNSAIGDALARLLRFSGYDVTVTNYIDDTGAQVADNIVGVKYLGFPERKEGIKLDHYLGDEVYVKVNNLYKEDPSLLTKRSEVLKAIEHGDNEIAVYARNMVLNVLKAQLQTLERLNVFYNLVNYESHILAYKFWATAFKQLKDIGAIKLETEGKKKGCWVFSLDSSESSGDDKILVRSDGTVVYAGKDIAYAMWKHGLLESDFRYKKFENQKNGEGLWTTTLDKEGEKNHPVFNGVKTSINVIDIRQSYEQNVVADAIAKLGRGKELKYIHYGYEVVALSKNTAQKLGIADTEDKEIFQMSGRKGIYINADDFLNQLHNLLYTETRAKNPELSEKDCHEIAEKLAVSTLRFEMIRTDPKNMIVFDIDKALRLEEKSAAYLAYTCARMNSIQKKAGAERVKTIKNVGELNETERKLLFEIARFSEVIETSAATLDLANLANYVSDFALAFNSFYVSTPVLKAEAGQMEFRLWLVDACKSVLENAMTLLGLVPVGRM